ncbi:MAG: Crp/Fnr family transcriptional regulator [Polyangiaceae bacterium]|nr:Crp/Fnr family transcriptional regulator [Polyangiaceae bacterium]
MSAPDDVIPLPLDDDDDDVAWALQTAAVQWRRGAKPDAVLWLRRAVESAMEVGHTPRAMQINALIAGVEELIVNDVFTSSPPPAPETSGVDSLLDTTVSTGRASIDVEFDEDVPTDIVVPSEQATPAPQPVVPPPATIPAESKRRRARPPPAPSKLAKAASAPPPPHLPRDAGAAPRGVPDQVFEAQTVRPGSDPEPEAPESFAPDSSPTLSTTEAEILGTVAFASPSAEPDVDALLTEAAGPTTEAAPAREIETEPASDEPSIAGVSLANVAGLQDLPPEAQAELVRSARIETLDIDEEVSAFAVALVVEGWASVMPSVADVACAFAQVGEVVFTQGTLEESVALRVVAGETDTRVAVWDEAALEHATSACPWVADELRLVADRYQALAGATIGPLGERLDDALRQMVTSRCEVRAFSAGEGIVTSGNPVPGMFIVGAGAVELLTGDEVVGELGPGEFLFATSVMSASMAPMGARAGPGGALLLFAERHAAHELMLSVPPLLEILAG